MVHDSIPRNGSPHWANSTPGENGTRTQNWQAYAQWNGPVPRHVTAARSRAIRRICFQDYALCKAMAIVSACPVARPVLEPSPPSTRLLPKAQGPQRQRKVPSER